LPSHLTMTQLARLDGVTRQAIYARRVRGTVKDQDILGTTMIPVWPLIAGTPEMVSFPVALPPLRLLALLEEAQRLIVDGDGEKPAFSALEFSALFANLTWPKEEET
jgi:hypothetical protein